MRLHGKHWSAVMDKESFELSFPYFMDLEGNDHAFDMIEEIGTTSNEWKLFLKKANRT